MCHQNKTCLSMFSLCCLKFHILEFHFHLILSTFTDCRSCWNVLHYNSTVCCINMSFIALHSYSNLLLATRFVLKKRPFPGDYWTTDFYHFYYLRKCFWFDTLPWNILGHSEQAHVWSVCIIVIHATCDILAALCTTVYWSDLLHANRFCSEPIVSQRIADCYWFFNFCW